jgi:hypothetical protein
MAFLYGFPLADLIAKSAAVAQKPIDRSPPFSFFARVGRSFFFYP